MNRFSLGLSLSAIISVVTLFHLSLLLFQFVNKVIEFPIRTFFGLFSFDLVLIGGCLIAGKGYKFVGGLLVFISSLTSLSIFFFYDPSFATPWSIFSLIGGILILSANIPRLSRRRKVNHFQKQGVK